MSDPALSPFEVLADELGVVAGQIEREINFRVATAIADLARKDAERELALTRLMQDINERVNARIAEVRNGKDAEPKEIAAFLLPEVERAVASLPKPEKGKDADPELIHSLVAEAVAAFPKPEDGKSVTIDEVRPLLARMVAELPKAQNGKDADPAIIERMVADAVSKIPSPKNGKDADPKEIAVLIEASVEKAVAAIPKPRDGAPGKLQIVKAWSEGVHYEGDVRQHQGATYQAMRDTGKEPGTSDDWQCIAAKGADGRGFTIRGTYSADKQFSANDVVAFNGGSFVALKDGAGDCPGPDWQLIAGPGKRGKEGEPGKPGKGEPGKPGAIIASWIVNAKDYSATPVMSDGTKGPAVEMRDMFEQFMIETR